MAESRDIVLKITADNTAAKKDLKDTERSLNANQKALQDLNREYKKGKIATDDYSKAVDGLTKENSELLLQQKQQDKNIKQNAKSVQELRNRYKQLRETANALNTSTKEGQERFKKLTEEAYATQEQIRDFDRSISGSNTLVGEYTRGILDAAKQQQVFGVSVGNISDSLVSSTKSISGTNKALKFFKIALASTGIGALVVALGSLITFLTKSEKGMRIINKVSAALGHVLEEVTFAAIEFGETIFNAITNPKQAIIDLGELIKENFINRFKAIALIGDALVDLFQDITNPQAWQDLTDSTIQLTTGITDATDKAKSFGKAVADTAKAGAALEDLRFKYQDLNRASQLLITQIDKERAAFEGIRDDATRSFKEREEAAENLRQANIKIANEELAIARRNLEQAEIINQRKIENGAFLSQEEKDQFVEVQRAFTEAEVRKTEVLNENNREINQLRQDRLERDLDILIDGFDNQKTINERKLKDEELTFQQRQAILDETARLADESFDKQVKTLQEQTGVQLNANELLKESNATVLNEKIRLLGLSEINEGRLLEVIRERRIVEQDLIELDAEQEARAQAKVEREIEAQNQLNEFKRDQAIAEEESEIIKAELEVQREIAKRTQLLQNQEITESERQLIIAKSEAEIKSIREKGAKAEREAQGRAVQFTELTENQKQQAALSTAQTIIESAQGIFGESKALASVSALINTFQAITNTLANVPAPLNIPVSVAVGALGVANVAKINGAKFEKGGIANGGLFQGPSHSNGGVKFKVGGTIHEAEGGEAIINKRSTRMFKPLLSSINAAGGGKKFAAGGLTSAPLNQAAQFESQNDVFQDAIAAAPQPVVRVSEINDIQSDVSTVVQVSSL